MVGLTHDQSELLDFPFFLEVNISYIPILFLTIVPRLSRGDSSVKIRSPQALHSERAFLLCRVQIGQAHSPVERLDVVDSFGSVILLMK
jgi:hypothetical protein